MDEKQVKWEQGEKITLSELTLDFVSSVPSTDEFWSVPTGDGQGV